MTRHIQGDGNGGLWVSRPFALISLIITLLIIFSSIVFGYAQMQIRIEAIETNSDFIIVNDNSIRELELMTIKYEDKIENIEEDITEIKADVKELLKR